MLELVNNANLKLLTLQYSY